MFYLMGLWVQRVNIFIHSGNKEGRKEMFYLMVHSTHILYGYMALDIW